jgi:copper(I)-binding protein
VNVIRVCTLVLGAWGASACDRAPAPTGASASVGDVQITRGVAWGLASSKSTTIGFQVTVGQGDTLVGVESPDGMAMLHDNVNDRMTHLERLAVDAGGTVSLGTGGPHIMLTETTHGYAKGDSVRVILQWARNGRLAVTVPLKNFTDAATLLEGR